MFLCFQRVYIDVTKFKESSHVPMQEADTFTT